MVHKTDPATDAYFGKTGKWQAAINHLRTIALDNGLQETLKWGSPCYTLDKKNIVLIHVFKDYCALLFFKGALMKDSSARLVQQSRQVQAARQFRFVDLEEILNQEPQISAYIREAIAVERSGRKVELRKTSDYSIAEEFRVVLEKDLRLKKAFKALTPGRQRGYLLCFSAAKQSATRAGRVEKCIPQMLAGKGLND